MDCLLIGEDSILAKQIKKSLQSDINLFCTSKRILENAEKHFALDFEKESDIRNINLQTQNGFAVFCASMSGFAKCEEQPQKSQLVNVTHTIKLAEKLSSLGWKIIYPSSSSVFCGSDVFPTVDTQTQAVSLYGRQKQEVEQRLLQLPDTLIIRFTKIIPQYFPLFINWVEAFKRGESIQAFSDVLLSPVSVEQAASTLLALVGEKGIWHVGAPDTLFYEQVAKLLLRESKKTSLQHQDALCKVLAHNSAEKTIHSVQSCATLNSTLTENFLQIPFKSSEDVVVDWFKQYTTSSINLD